MLEHTTSQKILAKRIWRKVLISLIDEKISMMRVIGERADKRTQASLGFL